MKRLLMVAWSAWILTATAALACGGQLGNTIFEDTFTDDSGGWDFSGGPTSVEVKDGKLSIHPNSGGVKEQYTNITVSNLTFSAGEADICSDFILPKAISADNNIAFGIVFLRQDKNNYYVWQTSTDKAVYLYKLTAGTWSTIYTNASPATPVKLEPNAVNSLRVIVKDGKMTLFLNDQQVKAIRTQMPSGELHFGVYGQADKASDQNPLIEVKSFKVTSGQ